MGGMLVKLLRPLLIILLACSTLYQYDVPVTRIDTVAYKEKVIPFTKMLYETAYSGTVEELEQLLNAAPDMDLNEVLVETILQSPHNPLGTQTTIMKALLARGVDVNRRTSNHLTPLQLDAMNTGHAMELLITNGANININGDQGAGLLFWAARNFQPNTITVLFDHGANPYSRAIHSKNPFIYLLSPDYPHFNEATMLKANLFLRGGINPNVKMPNTNKTVQQYLIEDALNLDPKNRRKLIDLISRYNIQNRAGSVIWNPYPNIVWEAPISPEEYEQKIDEFMGELYRLSASGEVNTINKRLDEANYFDVYELLLRTVGFSPLDAGPKEPIMEALLQRIPNKDRLGEVLTKDAYFTGQGMKVLIEYGADVSGKDGLKALYSSSSRSRPELVKLLLDHGVDVKADRSASLRGAVVPIFQHNYRDETVETVRILLEAGADPQVTLADGLPIIDYLKQTKSDVGDNAIMDRINQIIELLEDYTKIRSSGK
jgi:ankyrin repeat protein